MHRWGGHVRHPFAPLLWWWLCFWLCTPTGKYLCRMVEWYVWVASVANITKQLNLTADFIVMYMSRQGAHIQYTITLCTLYAMTQYGRWDFLRDAGEVHWSMMKSSLFLIYLLTSEVKCLHLSSLSTTNCTTSSSHSNSKNHIKETGSHFTPELLICALGCLTMCIFAYLNASIQSSWSVWEFLVLVYSLS